MVGEEHHRHRRDEEQLDDPRLGQRDVLPEREPRSPSARTGSRRQPGAGIQSGHGILRERAGRHRHTGVRCSASAVYREGVHPSARVGTPTQHRALTREKPQRPALSAVAPVTPEHPAGLGSERPPGSDRTSPEGVPPVSPTTTSRATSPLAKRSSDLPRPVAKKAGGATSTSVRSTPSVSSLPTPCRRSATATPAPPCSLAPAAYLLYQNVMTHDPSDPAWVGRDRFVLSCGHSSLTQYIQLYLSGYGLELSDLEALRTWGSRTPGHPEVHHTKGVEITTGPLGPGLASAVGMAMGAAPRARAARPRRASPARAPFDHDVYVLASDGDIMEGVSHEASSLAGHQELGNLTVVYDENHISIEDDTKISFSEDVARATRPTAGTSTRWTGVRTRPTPRAGTATSRTSTPSSPRSRPARRCATSRPSSCSRPSSRWPAPTKQNTGKSHGSALGARRGRGDQGAARLPTAKSFTVERPVLAHAREVVKRGKAAHKAWRRPRMPRGARPTPSRPRSSTGWSPATCRRAGQGASRPSRPTPRASPPAPRPARCSAPSAASCPSCGAARPTSPSRTTRRSPARSSFLPTGKQTDEWKGGPYGRTLHFGIREHAMGCILNGIALHGSLTRPYGGTFLVFRDYMRASVRLAALMGLPGDLRVDARLDRPRRGRPDPPAGRAPRGAAGHPRARRRPPGRRQRDRRPSGRRSCAATAARPACASAGRTCRPSTARSSATREGAAKGGYVLAEASGDGAPQVILVATGSEVPIAVEAREQLESGGIPHPRRLDALPGVVRASSRRPTATRCSPRPSGRASPSRPASPWAGATSSVTPAGSIAHRALRRLRRRRRSLFREFGFTAEAVVKAAKDSVKAAAAG